MRQISLFHTVITDDARMRVIDQLDRGWLSEGEQVRKFEERLCSEWELANPVCVNSGTSALHLALKAAGVGSGDVVVTSPQTFVATGLAILYCGAKVVFADIEPLTGNVDVASVSALCAKHDAKAFIAVDWAGYPCSREQLTVATQCFRIFDCAQSFGAEWNGYHMVGNCADADCECFSFQATKHLTTGDGGCVTTRLYSEPLRRLRWFGIDRKNSAEGPLGERLYTLDSIGYKYHMNDYAAALGIGNMQGLAIRLNQRRWIARAYDDALEGVAGINLPFYDPERRSSYWAYLLFADDAVARQKWIQHLKAHGIQASVIHQRIDRHPIFQSNSWMEGRRPGMDEFDARQFHIPCHDGMSDEDVRYVIGTIRSGW